MDLCNVLGLTAKSIKEWRVFIIAANALLANIYDNLQKRFELHGIQKDPDVMHTVNRMKVKLL